MMNRSNCTEKKRISVPRVMIAAAGSGSGKTLFTCGLLKLLADRGLQTSSFKCGPDYIDPMFHRQIPGNKSRNLDPFFASERDLNRLVSAAEGHYAVIEGVMGLYDGADVRSLKGSSYETACMTKTPVILIVDAAGLGKTVISVIKGILLDDVSRMIKGVILNRMSPGFFAGLKRVLEEEIKAAGFDTAVLGCLPKDASVVLESRHLGLKLPHETEDIRKRIEKMAGLIETHTDAEEIQKIMERAPAIETEAPCPPVNMPGGSDGKEIVLAVAFDEAFCFYYKENLEMLERRGVKIRYFSPVHDQRIPEDASGLLLGGGYPELYLKELSQNRSMLDSVREAIRRGIPSLAECGGFMYLHSAIVNEAGERFEMAGAVDGICTYAGKLVRFGYLEIEKQNVPGEDSFYANAVGLKGHEFHYYESSVCGDAYTAKKPYRDVKWNCIVADHNGLWGFPHFYYPSNPSFAYSFVEKMKKYR